MRKILLIILCIILCGCTSKQEEYQKLMEENPYVIIDVRTKEEYQEEHIQNAINIPYDELEEKISISKDQMIFVYCRSGSRSKIAYETLTNLGYQVYDLGGISKINLPKETE